jgi:2-keto-4-pentenoate hydratase/2-oxohepta-3-ene-1,7-dioic acid hydratase in catechol pathway
MKWVKVNHEGQEKYAVLSGNIIHLTNHAWEDVLFEKQFCASAELLMNQVQVLNPIGRPGKIVCVGLNYMDHCRETNTLPPERPLLFTKFTTSMIGPNEDIVWNPDLTNQVDFEAELGVVISKTCRQVEEKDALAYVAGYTAANDVSARDIQLGDGQWVRGKSLDTFCPLGPVFATCDEIPDPQNLTIRSFLNGEVMQDSNTKEMIFPISQIVSFCSRAFTLEPGDLILTGTPHGVGMGRDPKIYMQDGDLIMVEIEGIGQLENRCRVVKP